MLTETVHGLLYEPALAAGPAGEVKLGLSLTTGLVAIGLEIVERLILDRAELSADGGCAGRSPPP